MPTSRLGRIAAYTLLVFLFGICLAVNAYLAYRVTYPPRVLRVRVVLDPTSPALQGVLRENLKARVDSISSLFEQAAGIRLQVIGYANAKIGYDERDPAALGRYLEDRTPRDEADILVAFWVPSPIDSRLGSALPYSPVAVVRLDSGGPERDRAVLAHQLLSLFGVPPSSDPKSVMNPAPSNLYLDPNSRSFLMDTRLFDFSRGLVGMKRSMESRILDALGRQANQKGDPPRLVLAGLLMRDNHYATAVEQYRAVIAANAANVPARLGLAQALAMTDQFAAAETEARMGVKLAPELDESHYELGFVLARSGNPEAAVDEFRRAIALAPNSARNHAGLGVAYAASVGEFEGATREFAAASKLDPANPSLLADIVYVERLRARIDRDAVAAEAQVQAHPESGAARNRWAALLLRQGKTEQALDQLGKAIKLFPESWQMHYTMAVALYAAHDFAGSQGELDVAKKLGCGDRPHLQEALRAALAPRK